MQALTTKPYWATAVLEARKNIECVTWETPYRGPLLICSSELPWLAGTIKNHALCMVNLVDVVPFEEKHLEGAAMTEMPLRDCFAWIFDGWHFIEPIEMKDQPEFSDVPDELIKPYDGSMSMVDFAEKYYLPLVQMDASGVPVEQVLAEWSDWMGFLRQIDEQMGM